MYVLISFSLKSIDLVCMKNLDTKVNIIPIIAKADTISKTELQKFKVCKHFLLKLFFYLLYVFVLSVLLS